MKIYVDMDGVLADYNKGVVELITPSFKKSMSHFYGDLKMVDGAREMVDILMAYGDVEILTAIPAIGLGVKHAENDKKNWIKDRFGSLPVHCVRRKDKKTYATADSILIDNEKRNIKEWTNAGGIGILFKSSKQVMDDVRRIHKNKS